MRRRLPRFILALSAVVALGAGCAAGDRPPAADDGRGACEDTDGDGFDAATEACRSGEDCNDQDDSIHPDAQDICGNDVDEDCSMGDATCNDFCTDQDNDGYGEGAGCRGPDCDDNDPDRHPGARETCGNGVDENCLASDDDCSSSCTDSDGDGYGKMGANSACPNDGVDCDDMDADVHPGADETCNGSDDDCDGQTDECPVMQASCSQTAGGECRLSVGDGCTDGSLCPDATTCDPDSGECRKTSGSDCSAGECVDALSCKGGICEGDFCDQTSCPQNKPRCDSRQSRCVECAYWTSGPPTNCESGERCVGGGWCGRRVTLSSSQAVAAYTNVTRAILELSLALADCWKDKYDGPSPEMCAAVESAANLSAIDEKEIRNAFSEYKEAYENDNLEHMSDQQYNQLGKLLGDGWLDLNNLAWKDDISPGSKSTCIWYDNHGTFGRAKLHVQKCSDFDLPNQ